MKKYIILLFVLGLAGCHPDEGENPKQTKVEKSEEPQNKESDDKKGDDDNGNIEPSIGDWDNGGSGSSDFTEN